MHATRLHAFRSAVRSWHSFGGGLRAQSPILSPCRAAAGMQEDEAACASGPRSSQAQRPSSACRASTSFLSPPALSFTPYLLAFAAPLWLMRMLPPLHGMAAAVAPYLLSLLPMALLLVYFCAMHGAHGPQQLAASTAPAVPYLLAFAAPFWLIHLLPPLHGMVATVAPLVLSLLPVVLIILYAWLDVRSPASPSPSSSFSTTATSLFTILPPLWSPRRWRIPLRGMRGPIARHAAAATAPVTSDSAVLQPLPEAEQQQQQGQQQPLQPGASQHKPLRRGHKAPRGGREDERSGSSQEEDGGGGGGGRGPDRPPGVKRTVALHVGYIGTAFKGLQASRQLPMDETVEGILGRALLAAGCIAPCNYGDDGDFSKVKWSRNSRTDKGVHSLSTVINLRMLLPEGNLAYERDPEGLETAARINEHLPNTVRVFSVQRVQKKFNARRACLDRTYEYYLPAHVLGLSCSSAEVTQEDARRLALFREALSMFVGTHAFHNYTAARRKFAAMQKGAKKVRPWQPAGSAAAGAAEGGTAVEGSTLPAAAEAAAEAAAAAEAEAEAAAAASTAREHVVEGVNGGEEQEEEEEEEEGKPVAASSRRDRGAKPRGKKRDDSEDEADDGEAGEGEESSEEEAEGLEVDGPEGKIWIQDCSWVGELPKSDPDRIVSQHFRTMLSWKADDPAPLVPGGVPCLRLEVRGKSFLLHHIRHMIGAAVAVARGQLSLELIAASITSPVRMNVPRAPPHTLLLYDCAFIAFRRSGGEEATIAKYTGDTLTLRSGGEANRARFKQQAFDVALNELLGHPGWERFVEALSFHVWPEEGRREVLEQHAAWLRAREEAAEKRKLRIEAQKAAAAAEAEAEVAAAAEAGEEGGSGGASAGDGGGGSAAQGEGRGGGVVAAAAAGGGVRGGEAGGGGMGGMWRRDRVQLRRQQQEERGRKAG